MKTKTPEFQFLSVAALVLAGLASTLSVRADMIIEWNGIAVPLARSRRDHFPLV